MWTKLAHIVIKFRLILIIGVGLVTIFMADQLQHLELSYDFAKVVPANDSDLLYFKKFTETFGEDLESRFFCLKKSELLLTASVW